MQEVFKSKVDWWIPAVVLFTVAVALLGPLIDGELFVVGLVLALLLSCLEIVMFASVKYRIRGNKLGIRNFLYRWEWFPIDKIQDVRKTRSILSAPALSFDRIAIRFSDRSILKSSMPLEISPKNRDGFISRLREINPSIQLKTSRNPVQRD